MSVGERNLDIKRDMLIKYFQIFLNKTSELKRSIRSRVQILHIYFLSMVPRAFIVQSLIGTTGVWSPVKMENR